MNKAWLSEKNDPATTQAYLIGMEGEYRGQTVELSGRTRLGRHPQNEVCLSDATVSAFHVQMTQVSRGYEIMDLGSKNGTRLNGRWVRQPVILADQDVITLGNNTFCFRLQQPGREEHMSQTFGGSVSSEPNSEIHGHGDDIPKENSQETEPARYPPIIQSVNTKGPVPAARVIPGLRPRSPARRSGDRRRSRTVACSTFCALQVVIVVLALWPRIEELAGDTRGGPEGQMALVPTVSLQDESSHVVPEEYKEAANSDTVSAYEEFLHRHGDSEFRAEATNRIRELEMIESYCHDLKPEDPLKRMTAAYKLGLMGRAAMKSVPMLIPLLTDNTPRVWSPHMEGTASSRRKPDGSAETTFSFSSRRDSGWDGRLSSLIGAPSESTVAETKTPAEIAANALREITGENLGTSQGMWQNWWDNRQTTY